MSGMGDHAERVTSGADTTRFVLTMIVATVIVGVTAVVLSYAVLAPERVGHGGAAPSHYARS